MNLGIHNWYMLLFSSARHEFKIGTQTGTSTIRNLSSFVSKGAHKKEQRLGMQTARIGGITCKYSMIIQWPHSVDVLGVFFLQFVMLPGFTINIIYVGMRVKVIWLTAFFYYVSLICHNQPLFQQSYSADVSFSQYVLMEFFYFSQCTVSKTETVTIQRATIGVSCTLQTNWINLQPAYWHEANYSRPRAAEARGTAGKQEPDGSPFHSFSILCNMYPGISDMRRPPSHNLSAFAPPISRCDIFQGIWNLVNLLCAYIW